MDWLVSCFSCWLVGFCCVFLLVFVGSLTCLVAFLGLIFDWMFLGPVQKTHWIGVGRGGISWGLKLPLFPYHRGWSSTQFCQGLDTHCKDFLSKVG